MKFHKFPLVKWVSNDPGVLEGIPTSETIDGMEQIPFSELKVKVLGIKWSVQDDYLTINVKLARLAEVVTKRQATSIIAAIYDPCSFLGPVIMSGKSMLQEMWKQHGQQPKCDVKKSWDEQLPTDINPKFKKWAQKPLVLADLRIPRHVGYAICHTI